MLPVRFNPSDAMLVRNGKKKFLPWREVLVSPRLLQVLDQIIKGQDNKGIADACDISVRTAENHIAGLQDRLLFNSRARMVTAVFEDFAPAIEVSEDYPLDLVEKFYDVAARAKSPGLTEREAHILELMRMGHTAKSSSEELGISLKTVEKYISKIYRKLQDSNFIRHPSSTQAVVLTNLVDLSRRGVHIKRCPHEEAIKPAFF